MNMNWTIKKIKFRLKDRKVYKNKTLVDTGKTIKEALKKYNDLIKDCIKKGFNKC